MSEGELLELKGSVEEIVYRNRQNGYSVLTLNCSKTEVTAVGIMADVSVGDDLRLLGVWKQHPDYGQQFSFDYYESIMPETAEAILNYLSTRAVKGIGRVMASRLVQAFGDETLEVMKNDPQRLSSVKGISKDKAQEISQEVRRIFGMKEILVHLSKYHISALESIRIWKQYGDSSLTMIQQDPYVLCAEEIGVPFERADAIALSMEGALDDKRRIQAGLFHIIGYNTHNGHTCLPADRLVKVAAPYLHLPEELIARTASDMIAQGILMACELQGRTFLFLPSLYAGESYIAERLELMRQFPSQAVIGGPAALERFEQQNKIEYAPLQRRAILQAMEGGLLILTGGPGTGKTTTLNAILSLYRQSGLQVMLAAPTGRAARRMTELTGEEAKTIHRLLEVEWDQNNRLRFARNEHHPLECDALIIDEMSMVDTLLFESTLRALPLGCRLIMVGDSDQLPSVGAGNVLGDMIASGKIPTVQLTEIFRQSMQSLIITNAHRIVHGEMPEIRRTDGDFFFLSGSGKEKIAQDILSLCTQRLPKAYGLDPQNDIQVLCPGRKGDLGVIVLNQKLQAELNPPAPEKAERRMPVYTLRVGDKVMQTKNNYDISWVKDDGTVGAGVFNGDIGRIEFMDKSGAKARIRFDDRVAEYTADTLLNVELAYASTVHKSQGNEFEAVVMPLFKGPAPLYYRNLLYTAVTRAKRLLILVGQVSTLQTMVQNDRRTKRYTALQDFLERGESCSISDGT